MRARSVYHGSMAHMSNRDRISRAADEARASAVEKAAKKAAKPAAGPRPKRAPKAPVRMKIVWEICNGAGKVLTTYGYAEKAGAEAELARLSKTSSTHVLRANKVPME